MNQDLPAVVIVDKPQDMTSSEIVLKLKKNMRYSKVGHGGTLDPFATGLLPIFIGNYTKMASLFHEADKEYCATLKLGEQKDTGDLTGQTTKTSRVMPITAMQCKLIERALTGSLRLPIPIYSAKKVEGKPLYKLARDKKITCSKKYQHITVYDLSIQLIDERTILFNAKVSSGTYIRSLGELIAQKLNSVGHLTQLRRVAYFLPTGHTIDKGVSYEKYQDQYHKYSYYPKDISTIVSTVTISRSLYRSFVLGAMHIIPTVSNGWHIVMRQDKAQLGMVYIEKSRIKNRVFF